MSSSWAVSIGPRPRVDDRHLLRVASHLTERDRVVIRLLYDHRVLTSLQVCDVLLVGASCPSAAPRPL